MTHEEFFYYSHRTEILKITLENLFIGTTNCSFNIFDVVKSGKDTSIAITQFVLLLSLETFLIELSD